MAERAPIHMRHTDCPQGGMETIIARLEDLCGEMRALVASHGKMCADAADPFKQSAVNLLHYLALRQSDLRDLQNELAKAGLSSLGRAESHVMASVLATLNVARVASGRAAKSNDAREGTGFDDGRRLLREHAEALLGAAPSGRYAHIMVTMPAEAAKDYAFVRDLLVNGVSCVRINCAHDDTAIWGAIVAHVRAAEKETGRGCRILMDLAGPKLRTSALPPGPAVIKVRPQRGVYGEIKTPARIWLAAEHDESPTPPECNARLELPQEWIKRLKRGDNIRLRDARGVKRKWKVVRKSGHGCLVETTKTNYLIEKTRLEHCKNRSKKRFAYIGRLPASEGCIVLAPGDRLLLDATLELGHAAKRSGKRVAQPAAIGCTLPEVLADVRVGEDIWFDDGRIGGAIEAVHGNVVRIKITRARATGEKLHNDKGINLPSTHLSLSALTQKDWADLEFVAQHADMVGLSFVHRPDDIHAVQRALTGLTERQVAIVLKIETQRAFRRAPELLLAAMRQAPCGVMIARGDLAVECGFERLAEVQEELLWLSEAAHIPVIWATQVLDSLTKSGRASRAEITDAAMGDRAECVMLNKGPHILNAVASLDDILRRMQGHQFKKSARLRPLSVATVAMPDPNA